MTESGDRVVVIAVAVVSASSTNQTTYTEKWTISNSNFSSFSQVTSLNDSGYVALAQLWQYKAFNGSVTVSGFSGVVGASKNVYCYAISNSLVNNMTFNGFEWNAADQGTTGNINCGGDTLSQYSLVQCSAVGYSQGCQGALSNTTSSLVKDQLDTEDGLCSYHYITSAAGSGHYSNMTMEFNSAATVVAGYGFEVYYA